MFLCARCSWCSRVWRLKLRWWDDCPATGCRSSRTSRTSRRVVPSFQKAILSTAGSPLPVQLNNLSPLTVDTYKRNIKKTCNMNEVLFCWLTFKDDTNFLIKLKSNNCQDNETCFTWSRFISLYNFVRQSWVAFVSRGRKTPRCWEIRGQFSCQSCPPPTKQSDLHWKWWVFSQVQCHEHLKLRETHCHPVIKN